MIGINLAIASYSLHIKRFADFKLPRSPLQLPEISYSQAGTPGLTGGIFEPKNIWTITALLDSAELDLLNKIYRYQLLKRPRQATILSDYTEPIVEIGPRSRVMAAGEAEPVADGSGQISYNAEFYVWFTTAPVATEEGVFWQATATLSELKKRRPE